MLLAAALPAAEQSTPTHTCVQNCGSSAATPGPKPATAPRRDPSRESAHATQLALDEGILYFDRKDWNNAVRSFEEALQHSPDDDYVQKWLKAAQYQKAAKTRPPILGKDGTINPPPPIVSPPRRKGPRPDSIDNSPLTGDHVTIGGKG